MFNGTGRFMLIYGDEIFIPREGFIAPIDPENANLVRDCAKINETKIFYVANYFNMGATVENLNEDEIKFFRKISGKTIVVVEHIDQETIRYNVIVTKAEITKVKTDPVQNVLVLQLKGAEDVVFGTQLDGWNEYSGTGVDYINSPVKQISTTGHFSISYWVNNQGVDGLPNAAEYIFSQYISASTLLEITINNTSRKFDIRVGTGGVVDFYGSINALPITAGLVHIGISRTYVSGASVIKLYINGVDDANSTTANVTSPYLPDVNMLIGRRTGSAFMDNRLIQDVSIWNIPLDATEMGKLFTKAYSTMTNKPTDPTVCKAFYRCNESEYHMGSSPYTGKTIDYSGNNNHGTPVGITPATFCNQATP